MTQLQATTMPEASSGAYIWWFQRNRFVLWDYRKHPLARFRRRRRGRQSKHGRRGGKQNGQIRRWGGMSNSSRTPMSRQKPSAGIIAHGVGVTTMGLLGASSVHRRWYGPKQPAAMISGKRDVSGETEVENRGAKVS